MKKIVMLLLCAVVCSFAQFTKVFEEPVSPNVAKPVVSISTYNAENLNDIYHGYYGFQSGNEIKVLNVESQEIEFSANISSLQIDSSAYSVMVHLYKNLFKSDGKWTCLVYVTQTDGYKIKVYADGKLTSPNIPAGDFPVFKSVDGKLYLIVKTSKAVEIYLVRNDLPTTASIIPSTSFIAALKKIKVDGEKEHFNALGQEIKYPTFDKMPDYLKKTMFK